MKKWLNNPGLKITALVFAILIWLIIVNVNDPIMTRTINSVPVRVVNASYVESLGDTYKIRDGYDTIAVRVHVELIGHVAGSIPLPQVGSDSLNLFSQRF